MRVLCHLIFFGAHILVGEETINKSKIKLLGTFEDRFGNRSRKGR